jgi:sigma-B regulation protein RsbU (phosphoserine phosphatase)
LCNTKGITPLTQGTTLIGMFDPLPHITVAETYIEEESMLMLFTDGLTELENDKHEYFGEHELNKFLSLYNSLTPEQFNQKIMERINEYKGVRQFSDDISLLTCKLF